MVVFLGTQGCGSFCSFNLKLTSQLFQNPKLKYWGFDILNTRTTIPCVRPPSTADTPVAGPVVDTAHDCIAVPRTAHHLEEHYHPSRASAARWPLPP